MKVTKPIFILGAQRSGTTWLGKAFAQHPDIAYWGEIGHLWMWGNSNKQDDVLGISDFNSKIQRHIESNFSKYLAKLNKNRICDKTPSNCLRIPFIKAVFPDAKIILIIRDGRSVMSSTSKKLNQPKGIPFEEIKRRLKNVPVWKWYLFFSYLSYHRVTSRFKTMVGQPLDYWGIRPPGWKEWSRKYSPNLVLAKQWSETIKIATSEGRKLPSENYLEVRYEELAASPREEISRIINFVEIENPEPIIEYAVATADPSRSDKWKESLNQNILNEVKEIMEPTMSKLGYHW